MTRALLSAAFLLLSVAPAAAAEPQFKMPPPDLAQFLPLVSPALEKPHKEQFWRASLALERPDDWRGLFMASAFVAEIEAR